MYFKSNNRTKEVDRKKKRDVQYLKSCFWIFGMEYAFEPSALAMHLDALENFRLNFLSRI